MQTIYLDISNKGVVPTIYAKQGDVGRKFEVVLTDSGLPYIPTSGSAFSVWYSGTSGEGNYTEIGGKSAFSVNGNKVIVEMIAQMLSNDGEGILSLVLNDNGGNQIGLWSIRYVCESVPGANSEEAKEYYTAFSESVKKLSVESVNYPGCYYRTVNGVVEWVNPPMVPGVEYRTTERWNGKAVYCALVNFGLISFDTTSTQYVQHGLSATQIIRATGSFANGQMLPYHNSWEGEIVFDVTKGNIRLTVLRNTSISSDAANIPVQFEIWYTKD